MTDFAGALGASKAASTLLVLFIPSRDRGETGSHRAGDRSRLPGDRLPAGGHTAVEAAERQEARG